MDRTTLTRNLALLLEKGLIHIQEGDDARVREVTLTATGRAKLATAEPYWRAAQEHMTKTLGRAQLDRLLADLAATTAGAQAR